jgi:predicted AlkP superfamily pyrophosphatase or phosphodiesterase
VQRLAVVNIVGLTPSLVGEHTPALRSFAESGSTAPIQPAFPAVTCTAQANMLTGQKPNTHGIVGNGWYHRELSEIHFWKQSNRLIQAPKVWETLRQCLPNFTCANLFWWFNMASTVDFSVTPRPIYPADGRKIFDIYTWPYELRPGLKRDLGEFPFPTFWGPAAGRDSPQGPPDAASRWITRCAQWVERHYQPSLSLVYLPHLDYSLQRLGPNHPDLAQDLRRIDALAGELLDFYRARQVRVLVVSEYGITSVQTPVHLNRALRNQGWLALKDELGRELLDPGASQAFAVADHQVAHIYLNTPALRDEVRACCARLPGVASVLGPEELQAAGLNHPRCGDLLAVAAPGHWFTYYYWVDDHRAPDFARTVDIHRKPGYDPVELFVDPVIRFPRLKIASRLLQKRLGFRMLMDLIPLDATLVRGSHGALAAGREHSPLLITDALDLPPHTPIPSTDVHRLILQAVSGRRTGCISAVPRVLP